MSARDAVRKRLAWLQYRVRYEGEARETAPEFSDAERDALAQMQATQYKHAVLTCHECGTPIRAWRGIVNDPRLCKVCQMALLFTMHFERMRSKTEKG